MAAKRSAFTAPVGSLRRSKRLAQQPVEEPSDSLASKDTENSIEDPEPQQGNGDHQQDIDIDMGDEVEELDEEMEAEEVDVEDNNSRRERIERRQKILRQINLPGNIFERWLVDWLDIILAAFEASMTC